MPIEAIEGGGHVITGSAISYYQLLALRGMLKMEIAGMRGRRPAGDTIRRIIGSKTKKKEKLLAELQAYIDQNGETLARS